MKAEDLARLEDQLGLNDPLPVQYGKWLGRVLQGDLGMAVTSKRPVADEILDRLPNTLTLMGIAWAVTLHDRHPGRHPLRRASSTPNSTIS